MQKLKINLEWPNSPPGDSPAPRPNVPFSSLPLPPTFTKFLCMLFLLKLNLFLHMNDMKRLKISQSAARVVRACEGM